MAKKTEVLSWDYFKEKKKEQPKPKQNYKTHIVLTAGVLLAGITFAHGVNATEVSMEVIPAMAAVPNNFQDSLHQATAPIHELISGFAHEIYAVFMAWGAIQTMVGKSSEGFARMKVATLGYVLLFWVPWIVDRVNDVRPAMGG